MCPMREWRYKTDEAGKPRRFYGHRELGLWAALKVGRFAGPPLASGAVLSVVFSIGLADFPLRIVLWLAVAALILCIVVAALVHAYVALSGGIMSAEERSERLRKFRESRRGRW